MVSTETAVKNVMELQNQQDVDCQTQKVVWK